MLGEPDKRVPDSKAVPSGLVEDRTFDYASEALEPHSGAVEEYAIPQRNPMLSCIRADIVLHDYMVSAEESHSSHSG